jgi:hypothetical protein
MSIQTETHDVPNGNWKSLNLNESKSWIYPKQSLENLHRDIKEHF